MLTEDTLGVLLNGSKWSSKNTLKIFYPMLKGSTRSDNKITYRCSTLPQADVVVHNCDLNTYAER